MGYWLKTTSLLNLFLQTDSQDEVCELFTDIEPEQTAVKIEQNKPEDRHWFNSSR